MLLICGRQTSPILSAISMPNIGTRARPKWLIICWRTAIAILGGYAASSGYAALMGIGFGAAGLQRSEGMVFGAMSAFLVYLILILWMFVTTRPITIGLAILSFSVLSITFAEFAV